MNTHERIYHLEVRAFNEVSAWYVEYIRVHELIKSVYDHVANNTDGKDAIAAMDELEDLMDEILAEEKE